MCAVMSAKRNERIESKNFEEIYNLDVANGE